MLMMVVAVFFLQLFPEEIATARTLLSRTLSCISCLALSCIQHAASILSTLSR